jgi:general secretion pathway protein K
VTLAPARQRGFALLLVLWTMVLLALLGSRIAANGRAQAQIAANVRDQAVAEAAADGAVQEAAFHLLDAPSRRWAADAIPRRLVLPGAAVEVRVESETGKINPNLASAPLLAALLREVGADSRTAGLVADSVLRWRFPWAAQGGNDPTLTAYRAAGLDYGPAGAPFESLDEIGAVLGMTPGLLAKLRPHLSLYAGNAPDPSSADRVVLAAMRSLFGAGTQNAVGNAASKVVGVTAVAAGPNGTRFTRHAILGLGTQRGGDPVQVLAWDRAPA